MQFPWTLIRVGGARSGARTGLTTTLLRKLLPGLLYNSVGYTNQLLFYLVNNLGTGFSLRTRPRHDSSKAL